MPIETAVKRQERILLYQEYMESGQSMKGFSTERGLNYWVLKSAIKKTEAEVSAGGTNFQEVALPANAVGSGYTVRLRNGRELEIPALFSEKRVRQLVEVLEQC